MPISSARPERCPHSLWLEYFTLRCTTCGLVYDAQMYTRLIQNIEGEMTANVLPKILTIEIGGTPTLTFEVQHLREAR